MPRYRILIVDDQRDIRRILSTGLSTLAMDIEVVDVPSAEEAMLVAHSSIDLMISDVRLPGISGLDLFRRIQKIHPKMKIMLMTGMSDPKIREEVAEAGAVAFFYKPVDLGIFLAEVQRVLLLDTEAAAVEAEPRTALQVHPGLIDRLEDLRRKAFMDQAAVLDAAGNLVVQAGIRPEVCSQAELQTSLKRLHAAGISLADHLAASDAAYTSYISGQTYHFYLASIRAEYMLVLIADQPFQHKLSQLSQWLPEAIRELGHLLVEPQPFQPISQDHMPAPPEPAQDAPEPLPSIDQELAGAEMSLEDLAAVDALFDPAGHKEMKSADLDEFWDSVTEETTPHQAGDGAISYDDARDMGLAPE